MRVKQWLAVGIAGAIALGTVSTARADDWRLTFSTGRVWHGDRYYYWNGHNYDTVRSDYYRTHYYHHRNRGHHYGWRNHGRRHHEDRD